MREASAAATAVPERLRFWFVVHFVVDILFALPLLLAPRWLLGVLDWPTYDPVTTRLVGAALVGIGVESWLGRNAGRAVFKAMLNLKVLWASSAVLAIALGIADGAAPAAWLFLGIFAAFLGLWSYYRWRLRD